MLTRSLLVATMLVCLLTPPAAAQQTRPDPGGAARSASSHPASTGRTIHRIPYPEYVAQVQPSLPVGAQAAGWTNVVTENFEGTWPTGLWDRFDGNNHLGANGDYCWGAVNFQAYRSARSAWPAAACANALNPATSPYPNLASSWMVYGPFSLVGATAGYASIKVWNQTVGQFSGNLLVGDGVGVYASINDDNQTGDYFGVVITGNTTPSEPPTTDGWSDLTLDLTSVTGLGNLMGQQRVWIGVIFDSDASQVDNGSFVDDLVVAKRVVAPSTIGGRNLTLRGGPPGSVNLTWNAGTAETGYLVLRWSPVQGFKFFPENVVPQQATTFTDTSQLTDEAYCYLVLPVGGSPPSVNNLLGFSDFFCLYSTPASGTNPVTNFSISLRQSDLATLTWTEAVGPTGYRLEVNTFDGGPPTTVSLAPGSSPYVANTQGKSTCYTLATLSGGQNVTGRSQKLCAVPGLVSLKTSGGFGEALQQAATQLSSGPGARTR